MGLLGTLSFFSVVGNEAANALFRCCLALMLGIRSTLG